MKYIVVDSGALFKIDISVFSDLFFTTSSVLDEIKNKPSKSRIEFSISAGRLKIQDPLPQSINYVMMVSKKSGDYHVLSATDIGILALAYELSENNTNVELWSNDFAVQNVANILKLKWQSPAGRIKKTIIWHYRCPGCGKRFTSFPPEGICDVCGTPVRRYSGKKRRGK